MRHVNVVDRVRSVSRQIQQTNDVEHRRFAGAGATHDGNVVAGIDVQVDATQNSQVGPVG